ncbi:MAG: hypothetical protein U1B80_04910, partial [Anaerolineaceae bacterium]|nr:hypothetical protein [Anaerolineaceae bacterium]
RQRVLDTLEPLKEAGITHIRVDGEGDVADICRLTCHEQNFTIAADHDSPLLRVQGLKVFVSTQDGELEPIGDGRSAEFDADTGEQG